MDDKRKKELQTFLDEAIRMCNGTLEMDLCVRDKEEAAFLKAAMKSRKKVKNLGVKIEKSN
jgi:hypothetical protein